MMSAAAFVVTTVLFVLPPLLTEPTWPGGTTGMMLALLLIPQAIPLSLPIGVCVGVLCGMRGRRRDRRHLSFVLALGITCAAVGALVIGWLMPAANQAFRETLASFLSGRSVDLEPGLNELGFSALRARQDAAARHTYQLLLSVCFAPVPLTLLALSLSTLVRRTVVAAPLALLTVLGYWQVMFVTADRRPESWYAITVAPWLPSVIFLVAACLLLRLGRVRPPARHGFEL
jgi:lipopolysaccharide export LptBFGC system permease protein LptF